MENDLIFAFAILITLVLYLIYTRNMFENKMLNLYEDKYKNWKKHAVKNIKKDSFKELVGLVYIKDDKMCIEAFSDPSLDKLKRGKFTIRRL